MGAGRLRRGFASLAGVFTRLRWPLWWLATSHAGRCRRMHGFPRPASTMPPAAPILSATPAELAPPIVRKSKRLEGADFLHGIASWVRRCPRRPHRDGELPERSDMYAMTACHPTLLFGTVVRRSIRNTGEISRSTHSTIAVFFRDEGRVIDLSPYAAALEL